MHAVHQPNARVTRRLDARFSSYWEQRAANATLQNAVCALVHAGNAAHLVHTVLHLLLAHRLPHSGSGARWVSTLAFNASHFSSVRWVCECMKCARGGFFQLAVPPLHTTKGVVDWKELHF